MNVVVARSNLHQGLAAVSASIPSKTTLPVLSNVLLEIRDGELRLSGTDLDFSVRVAVPAEVLEEGAITAPGRKLQEIARELPDSPVTLKTRGNQLELRCGRSQFRLNGIPSEDFPSLPALDFRQGWKVTGSDLHKLIHHTSFAVSTEESRPILNGVLWELRDGRMRMVATNGHRLARMQVLTPPSNVPSANFVVPPPALQHAMRLFRGEDEIEVAHGGNELGFRTATVEIYTRLIEGVYPNYEQVIPKDNDKVAIVSKDLFTSTVRRMAVVASDQTHRVRLRFSEGKVQFNVLTPDLGEAEDELELHYEGEPLEIGFNANYLLEILRYIPTEEVKMTFKAPERAATLEPVGTGEEEVPDYLCLVMPLRLLD